MVMLKLKICAHSVAERKNNKPQHFVPVTDNSHPSIQSNKVGSIVVGYAAPYHHRSTLIGIMLFDGILMMKFMKTSPIPDQTFCEFQIKSRLIAEHGIAPMSKLPCLILCSPRCSETYVFSSHPHFHDKDFAALHGQ
jgi:hypothetical protein